MFSRYAIYFLPQSELAARGAAWLGWDIVAGRSVPQPQVAGVDLARITQSPRSYGLHATIKPPFALQADKTPEALEAAFVDLCRSVSPVSQQGLAVERMGGFLALLPLGPQDALTDLAATFVRDLDAFRAPLSPAALAHRRQARLTAAQERNLQDWGYPHVMEAFRFHITLTGRLPDADALRGTVADHFATALPSPFVLGHLSLVGEGPDGMFRQILCQPLGA